MISVIVPYWNAEKWLGDCLESLHKQEGGFEFILVNDASEDGSLDIAKEYAEKDERFVLLDNQRKQGVSGARNTGLDNAKGEYIAFIDADDVMMEHAFETIISTVNTYPKASVIQFNHYRYYPTTGVTAMKYWNKAGAYDAENLPKMWFGVWNKVYKAYLLKKIRFDEGLLFGEDGLFALEVLAKAGKFQHANVSVAFVIHRFVNGDSLSHRKTKALLLKQIKAYENFMLKQKDPKIKWCVCKEIANLWTCDRTKDLLCEYGEKK